MKTEFAGHFAIVIYNYSLQAFFYYLVETAEQFITCSYATFFPSAFL